MLEQLLHNQRPGMGHPSARGAILRPVRLPTDGLHALLTLRLWCFTVSNSAACRHCPLCCLPCGASLRVSTAPGAVCNGDTETWTPQPDGREHPRMAGNGLP
jgi:hypothetical protein